MPSATDNRLTLFLCGDVMTGRGIDQILPHPSEPSLIERYVTDAREYVQLAETASGPIHQPVDFKYIWGDALDEMHRADIRIINLETSLTTSNDAWPGKGINYRMHPRNTGCLTAGRIDCCCLANNHVLDWGRLGLRETISVLDAAVIAHAGAGCDRQSAMAPAIFPAAGAGRVIVFSFALSSGGVPQAWAATSNREGIYLLPDLSCSSAESLFQGLAPLKCPGDIAIASVHWGDNWGYDIPREQIDFAHRLVAAGFDVVHGHSSHHPKGIEVYQNRPILYGCGDFVNDYEGIQGYEEFYGEIRLAYLLRIESSSGKLITLRIIPLRSRRLRLDRASVDEINLTCEMLNREGSRFGTRFTRTTDSTEDRKKGHYSLRLFP